MGGFDQGPNNGITAWGAASTAQFSFAGDPNGNVTALAEGDLCVDTATPALYQAAGPGTVWTAVGGGSVTWGAASTAQFTSAGDPNGNVTALAEGDLCVDTATPALYQAPGAGTVWTLITPPIVASSHFGDPLGSLVPPFGIGTVYIDTNDGAVYLAVGVTDTDWVGLGGNVGTASGVTVNSGLNDPQLTDGSGGNFIGVGAAQWGGIYINAAAGQFVQLISGNKFVIQATDNGSVGLLGLYSAAPVVQPAAITAPTGGAVVDAESRTAITAILNALGAAAGGIGVTA